MALIDSEKNTLINDKTAISVGLLITLLGAAVGIGVEHARVNQHDHEIAELRANTAATERARVDDHASANEHFIRLEDNVTHTREAVDEIRTTVRQLDSDQIRQAKGHR